jgi:hypothetical protein
MVAFTLTGCAASTTDTSAPTANDGQYAGTYSGDDSGPVSMNVSGTSVDVTATVGGIKYPGSGGISSNGGVSVGIGAGNGVTVSFEGVFANGEGSGTWKSTVGTHGDWSVAR